MNSLTEGLRFDAGGVELSGLARARLKMARLGFFLAAIASVGAHAILLAIFGIWFRFSKPLPPRDDTIPVTIELQATGLAGGGGGSAAMKRRMHQVHHFAPTRSTIVAMPKSRVHRHIVTKPVDEQIGNPSQPELKKSAETRQSKVASIQKSVPVPGSPSAGGAAKAAADGTGTAVGGGNGSGNGVGSGTGSGGGYGTGGNGPEAIYAPAPTIPDDMRDQVMRVVAVARFEVSRSGTAKVTLLSATEYSELNDIILDTLEQWRFKPAMSHGVAIDSVADVRLLISVK